MNYRHGWGRDHSEERGSAAEVGEGGGSAELLQRSGGEDAGPLVEIGMGGLSLEVGVEGAQDHRGGRGGRWRRRSR